MARLFKDFRVVLLSHSLFKFGKTLPHPRGIRPSFFAPGQGIRQKIAERPGLARSEKSSWGLPGGEMYPVGID